MSNADYNATSLPVNAGAVESLGNLPKLRGTAVNNAFDAKLEQQADGASNAGHEPESESSPAVPEFELKAEPLPLLSQDSLPPYGLLSATTARFAVHYKTLRKAARLLGGFNSIEPKGGMVRDSRSAVFTLEQDRVLLILIDGDVRSQTVVPVKPTCGALPVSFGVACERLFTVLENRGSPPRGRIWINPGLAKDITGDRGGAGARANAAGDVMNERGEDDIVRFAYPLV